MKNKKNKIYKLIIIVCLIYLFCIGSYIEFNDFDFLVTIIKIISCAIVMFISAYKADIFD